MSSRLPGPGVSPLSLRALPQSATVRIVAVFVISGLGFTGGSLILARIMDPSQFGAFALLLAIAQVITPMGPLGVDVLVNRYRVRPDARVLARVGAQSLLISALISVVATAHFALSPALGATLFVAGLTGALNRVAAAWYQSAHRHGPALWLSQSQNLAILLAAIAVLGLSLAPPAALAAGASAPGALVPSLIVTAGYALACVAGWRAVLRPGRAPADASASTPPRRLPVVEGLAVVGAGGAELLLVQTDRLVIPSLLSMEQLATFAVLVATMGAPFRVLQLAAGYSTVPRMRAAASVAQRWRILAHEGRVLGLITLAGSVTMWIATPWLVQLFVGDKYTLGPELLLAALLGGVARVLGAFSSAAVTAVGAQRHLFMLTLVSWGSVAVGLVGAVIGARWGLAGVVYGVATGWIMRAVGACMLLPASLNCTRLITGTPPAAAIQR